MQEVRVSRGRFFVGRDPKKAKCIATFPNDQETLQDDQEASQMIAHQALHVRLETGTTKRKRRVIRIHYDHHAHATAGGMKIYLKYKMERRQREVGDVQSVRGLRVPATSLSHAKVTIMIHSKFIMKSF